MNQLHSQGFYQRLHLMMEVREQEAMNMISSLHGLETLHLDFFSQSSKIALDLCSNLKCLGLKTHSSITQIDLESTAKSLINLEELCFIGCEFKVVEPFIQYSIHIKRIYFDYGSRGDILNLSALNQKREQLVGAKMITIYLKEDEYMATKWRNKSDDLKLIEIKRAGPSNIGVKAIFYS